MYAHTPEFYDAIYAFKNYEQDAARYAEIIRARAPHARTLLDVACGTGEHAARLASNWSFDVDGLDLDPKLLEIARRKHSNGRFYQADMSDFDLDRRYDAVTCLFSSIAYLVTAERVTRALIQFKNHLAVQGVVLVEPWFAPNVLDPTRVDQVKALRGTTSIERTCHTEIDGRISRLHFRYRLEDETGIRYIDETHELGLFAPDEMRACFVSAGLVAELDERGLTGRGLWIATRAE